jgi:glutamate-1-semialdehyde 2,1-aminomutase
MMDTQSRAAAIIAHYEGATPRSRELMMRAQQCMPGGNTRTTTYHAPYPVVFSSGQGARLTDLDGRDYVDLFYNGLSLIHGHAYEPIEEAAAEIFEIGTAWSGASVPQVEFAEMLCRRIPGNNLVRFTNSGSEAGILAVKIARKVTGRDLILKFDHAYHGMYPDLEAGLYRQGEIRGTTVLAGFNDFASCEAAFAKHRGKVAAVIYEPVMFTGRVIAPEPGFLTGMEWIAKSNGALTILDDCLMLRLAEGGSAEYFHLSPDLTILGKFLGGGTPLGAVLGSPDLMAVLDPRHAGCMFHGGSFNGNVLSCALGRITLRDLTAKAIDRMNSRCDQIRARLRAAGEQLGLRISVTGIGSVGGISFELDQSRHENDPSAIGLSTLFHLACLNEGVALGPGGLFALSTKVDDQVIDKAVASMERALRAVVGLESFGLPRS